jgi:hypothetical protein
VNAEATGLKIALWIFLTEAHCLERWIPTFGSLLSALQLQQLRMLSPLVLLLAALAGSLTHGEPAGSVCSSTLIPASALLVHLLLGPSGS